MNKENFDELRAAYEAVTGKLFKVSMRVLDGKYVVVIHTNVSPGEDEIVDESFTRGCDENGVVFPPDIEQAACMHMYGQQLIEDAERLAKFAALQEAVETVYNEQIAKQN